MIPEIEELLERARMSQKAAANLLRDGFANFAASRAYYSMFYVAQALLLSKGLSFSSHSAVIAAYGKEFAKTKLLNPEFHRLLMDAQDKRNIGDYGMIGGIEDEDAEEIPESRGEIFHAGVLIRQRRKGESEGTYSQIYVIDQA